MAESKQKITQYFSNIVVRTLAKDLAAIIAGGGLISYTPRAQLGAESLGPILPPELSVSTQSTPSAPVPQPAVSATPISQPVKLAASKATTGDKILYLLLASLGAILVASVGYWVVFPQIKNRLASTPTPSPSFAPSALPSPTVLESFNIQLTQALPETVLALREKTSQALAQALTEDLIFPAATSTLRVYNVTDSQGKQLTSQELANLVVPDALLSFRSALGDNYLLVSYYLRADQPLVGIVFSIKPDNLSLAQTLMKNWESAGLEDYFEALYTPYAFSGRKTASFQNLAIEDIAFRSLALNSDNSNLELVYGFQGRFLLIGTNREVIQALNTRL